MKYITKPIVIDAVQYIKGMEDGFTESLETGLDVPYIQNTKCGIMQLICDGDWIITEDGRRRVCSNSVFNKKYESVE